MTFIAFWLSKALVELMLMLMFVVPIALAYLPQILRQSRCKHDAGVSETSACDAICRKCGKNLGFIGTWREKDKA
jgi:hypothetical protein